MPYFSEMPQYATHIGLCVQEGYVSGLLCGGSSRWLLARSKYPEMEGDRAS
jgi:hypothetical protein